MTSIIVENTPTLMRYDSDEEDSDMEEELNQIYEYERSRTDSGDTVEFEPSPKRVRRSAMSMQDVEKLYDTDYLAKVNIENYKTTNPTLMTDILNQDIFNFTLAKNAVDSVIQGIIDRDKSKKRKHADGIWTYCTGGCVSELAKLINKELKSTAFILRFMSNSTIDITADDDTGLNGEHPLTFIYNNPSGKQVTGIWENDKELFDLKPLDLRKGANARFIAGLGPSAAGKTYWAKNAIKLLGETDPTFPKSFLSIDGGAAREFSVVYQDIIQALESHPEIGGFKNLVSAGWDPIHTSLFSAGKAKKSAIAYLKEQKKKNNGKALVSLYVPETLGNPLENSKKKLDKFVEATGDYRWIGLYIWQGVTPKKDKVWVDKIKKQYPALANENIEAKSTTVSGQSREKTEGKLYSSSAYGTSKTHGLAMMKIAPGARIDIHNSGGKKTGETFNKSVVQEYPNKDGRYILSKELLTPYNAIYIQKSGKKKGGRRTRKIRLKKNRRTRKRGGMHHWGSTDNYDEEGARATDFSDHWVDAGYDRPSVPFAVQGTSPTYIRPSDRPHTLEYLTKQSTKARGEQNTKSKDEKKIDPIKKLEADLKLARERKDKKGGHHEALLLGALALTRTIKGKSRKKRKKKNRKKGTNKLR